MNTAKIILGALLLVFSLSFAATLTPGPVSTCGVINTPGTYNVQNDLTNDTVDCIVIDADNVNLNGNGYSISATSGSSYAVYVTEGSDNVVVDRCTLKDSLAGIRAGGDGPDAGSDATPVTGLTLRNVVANYNGYGFELLTVTDSLIEHNFAHGNKRIGFELSTSDGNTVQYNNVWLTGGDINSPQDGFYLKDSSNNRLIGNTANQNAKHGFSIVGGSNGNTLVSNVAEQNEEIGFEIAGDANNNILDSNLADQNDVGFWLGGSGDNVPDGNRLYGNTAINGNFGMQLIYVGTQNGISGSTISNNRGGGIIVTDSQALDMNSNVLTGNGAYPTSSGIMLVNSVGYVASDNVVDGSPNGIKILNSNMGTLDNTIISNSPYPLLVQDSTGNQITAITVKDSGPVLLRGDATNNGITLLTMRDPTGEVTVDIPVYSGEYEVSITTAPGAAPEGLTALNRYVSVVNTGGVPMLMLAIHYEDSDLGTLNESTVTAMLWGGSWSAPAQTLSMGSDGVLMDNPGFGTFGLFAGVPPEEPPVVPPVTPPSGGHTGGGSSGGSGGRAGSGGAVHIGVPYVPSGGEGFGGEATPSCTSDSDCASSATCSGGICTALEAGSSCGTFQDHAWVDFECCDTSDCGAGEVCKDNTCTSMEPLVITASEGTNTVASDEGIGRLLADVPWWVLALLLLMVGGGIYARYAMGREEPPGEGEEGSEEELPPAGEEEE